MLGGDGQPRDSSSCQCGRQAAVLLHLVLEAQLPNLEHQQEVIYTQQLAEILSVEVPRSKGGADGNFTSQALRCSFLNLACM